MAKTSMKAREAKRAKLAAKFATKRTELKAIIVDMNASEERVGMLSCNCNSCPVIPVRPASVTVATSLVVRTVSCGSLASLASRCVSMP